MLPYRLTVRAACSLVPRPSSCAVDPLPEKNKREQGLIYSFGEEGMQLPIVTVQTSKFFSVTKNSNIAQVRTRACQYCLWKRVLKIVTLKNFDGCTSCMPSSPKEYISPWREVGLVKLITRLTSQVERR